MQTIKGSFKYNDILFPKTVFYNILIITSQFQTDCIDTHKQSLDFMLFCMNISNRGKHDVLPIVINFNNVSPPVCAYMAWIYQEVHPY